MSKAVEYRSRTFCNRACIVAWSVAKHPERPEGSKPALREEAKEGLTVALKQIEIIERLAGSGAVKGDAAQDLLAVASAEVSREVAVDALGKAVAAIARVRPHLHALGLTRAFEVLGAFDTHPVQRTLSKDGAGTAAIKRSAESLAALKKSLNQALKSLGARS